MRVLVTGSAGFIGFHVARGAAGPRRRGDGLRQPQRLLRPGAQGGAARRARPHRRRDRRALRASTAPTSPTGRRSRRPSRARRRALRPGDPPRRPGRGAPQPRAPDGLRREQPRRLRPRARGLPAGRTPHLVFASTSSVYGANTAHAVPRGPGRRPPAAALRRHQAGQRADGARLRPPLRPALHRPALLHRLRALGPARHGADALRRGDPRRPADRGLQPRPAQPRLHLRRRHRRGGDPRRRPSLPCPTRAAIRPTPTRRPRTAPFRIYNIGNGAPVPLEDFIAALEARARPPGGPRARCRCSPATSPTPGPRQRPARGRRPAGGPATPVAEGVRRFVDWYLAWAGRER